MLRTLHARLLAPCLLIALTATSAAAQDDTAASSAGGATRDGLPGWAPALPMPNDETGAISGAIGAGKINEDWYLQATVDFELNFGKFGAGIRAPINLKVKDNSPKQADFGGVLRKQDWDEYTDYARIIRYLRWGRKNDSLYILAGELRAATIGHGTLMYRFHNNLDLDHFNLGLQWDVNLRYGGIETVMNDILDPEVIGGRVYIRPFTFFGGGGSGDDGDDDKGEDKDKDDGGGGGDGDGGLGLFDRIAVGFTYLLDRSSPWEYRTRDDFDDEGNFIAEVVDVDDDGNPNVQQAKDLRTFGFDLEWALLKTGTLSVIPYADVNHIMDGGTGFHLGVLGNFTFPVIIDLNIDARLEYRVMGENYAPQFYSYFYQIERESLFVNDDGIPIPKSCAVLEGDYNGDGVSDCGNRFSETKQGYYGELVLNFMGWISIGALMEDYQGAENGSLGVMVGLPAFEWVQLHAVYLRRGFDFDEGPEEAFAFDEKSLLFAQASVQIIPPFLFLIAQFNRRWVTDPDNGRPDPADDWNFGLGTRFAF